jgi:ATP-dependent DNA helicase RecQ
MAKRLRDLGHSAAAFDADLPLDERDSVMSSFARGEIRVVCATGAFGMGVDIPT